MSPRLSSTTVALSCLLSACTFSTPGSQATVKGQDDCIAAAARRYKQPPEDFRVDGSAITTSANLFEVRLSNTRTGHRAKCTVDENGMVLGVIDLR